MGDYKLKKGLVSDRIGDKTKIFDGEKSLFYTFNETATFIFTHLKKGLTKKDIIENLIKKYDIGKERAEKDFDVLMADLKAKGIIS